MIKLHKLLIDAIYKRTSQCELDLLTYIAYNDNILIDIVKDKREGITQETMNDTIVLSHTTNPNEFVRIDKYHTTVRTKGEEQVYAYSYNDNIVLWTALAIIKNQKKEG